MHAHVQSADGEAKFWMEPTVELDQSHGMSAKQLRDALGTTEARADEIRNARRRRFGG